MAVKLRLAMGASAGQMVAEEGDAIPGGNAVSVNFDFDSMSRRQAVTLLQMVRRNILRGEWPMAGGAPGPEPGEQQIAAIKNDGAFVEWVGALPPEYGGPAIALQSWGYDAAGVGGVKARSVYPTVQRRKSKTGGAEMDGQWMAAEEWIYAHESAVGAVNHSEVLVPKPICGWLMPEGRLVGDVLTLEISADHCLHNGLTPVACVKFLVTDGVDTVTAIAALSSKSTGSGLHIANVYRADVDISTLANGGIRANFEAYPHYGNPDGSSVARSADAAQLVEQGPRTFFRHAAMHADPVHVYFAATPGSSPVASTDPATAKAEPFATRGAALIAARALNNSLYGVDSTDGVQCHPLGVGADWTINAGSQWLGCVHIGPEHSPDPLGDPDDIYEVELSAAFTSVRSSLKDVDSPYLPVVHERIAFRRLPGVTASIFSSAAPNLALITLIGGVVDMGDNSSGHMCGTAALAQTFDTEFENVALSQISGPVNFTRDMLGCEVVSTATDMIGINAFNVQGCILRGASLQLPASLQGDVDFIARCSTIPAFIAPNATGISPGMVRWYRGISLVGLVPEFCANANNAIIRLFADAYGAGGSGLGCDHLVMGHNSIPGVEGAGRMNAFYNDARDPDPDLTPNNVFRNVLLANNIIEARFPCKGDDYQAGSIPPGVELWGNEAVRHGTGMWGNYVGLWPSTGELPYSYGRGSHRPAPADPQPDYGWADDQAATGTGGGVTAGNGDYRPTAASPWNGKCVRPIINVDLDGVPVTAGGQPGAYQTVTA